MTTREQAKNYREVLEHFEQGGEVQCRALGLNSPSVPWIDDKNPLWNFNAFEYRAKPSPIIVYANIMYDGRGYVYPSYEQAFQEYITVYTVSCKHSAIPLRELTHEEKERLGI